MQPAGSCWVSEIPASPAPRLAMAVPECLDQVREPVIAPVRETAQRRVWNTLIACALAGDYHPRTGKMR